MNADVIVLGAGIVGLGCALQIQSKGKSVLLVDRAEPGAATSFGNAGIIERASIYPYAFPRKLSDLVRYGMNRETDAYYHASALPTAAPWLARYYAASTLEGHERAARSALPLIENSLSEHEPLIAAAGAGHLVRRSGWIKAYRDPAGLDRAVADVAKLAPYGLDIDILDPKALARSEPHLSRGLAGAIHYKDPASITDPQELSSAYRRLFEMRGGRFLKGDAATLRETGAGRAVTTEAGEASARDVVIALGPWGAEFAASLGYRLPMGVKRGYHAHYKPAGDAVLHHTVYDADVKYVLAPMRKGIRLTTGAEFAVRDAKPTPVQLTRIEPKARAFFPIGERIEKEPWLGSRPCTPDMVPLIGPAPRHEGLWFAFGHAHHGLTLSAVTGRLLAEMIAGEETFCDPTPYRVDRF